MRKKIILAIAAIMVMGLALASFAYTRNSVASAAAACCCCSGDSCPMKNKDASGKETAAIHENCDCCKGDAESCPMKTKGSDSATAMKAGHAESCPMKAKGSDSAVSVSAYNLNNQLYFNHISFIKDISPEIGRRLRFSYTVRLF